MSSADGEELPQVLPTSGARMRQFAGESDFAGMADVLNDIARFENVTADWNVQMLRNHDAFLANFDPTKDRVIVEAEGKIVGVGRVEAIKDLEGNRMHFHSCNVSPAWRDKGIEEATLAHQHRRLREMAKAQPLDGQRFFQTWGVHESNAAMIRVLSADGYAPVRFSYSMLRPNLDSIPDRPLPAGIEARPVQREHLRQMWDANREAFRDHWGYVERGDEAFEAWCKIPDWDWNLSRVAWAGDEVVGMVSIFVPTDHNKVNVKQRAFTEGISVRRPWRKQGVASALIALCLHALRDAGFDEAVLGVDTENLSGALKIYQSMGYQVTHKYATYRKTMA